MSENHCVRCGKPTPDGYACSSCAYRAGDQLHEIADMAGAARDVAHGFARRGGGGASGKPGSSLPFDLSATSKLDSVQAELTTWTRHVAAERGILTPFAIKDVPAFDPILKTAEYLAGHVEWMRHRAEADEFLAAVDACARVIRGIARGPAEQKYLGPCGAPYLCDGIAVGDQGQPYAECGEPESHPAHELSTCEGDVYASRGSRVGRCRLCGAEVSTGDRQAWLDGEVRSHAFRAAQIAEAYGVNVDTIRSWAARGQLVPHGHDTEGRPLFSVGDVLDLAAASAARRATDQAKRARRAAAKAAEEASDAA